MKFRQIYDPDKVYEDWFEAYFIRPFFHHYLDLGGYEPARSARLSFATWVLVTLGFSGLLMGLVGLLGIDVGFITLGVVGGLWILASVIPLIGLYLRGRRGELHPWKHNPKFLGVDTFITVVCLLFFIFGLLMMITTVNSETLRPNNGYVPEEESSMIESDTVREEPIFTWQDERPVETDSTDILPEDPEAIDPDDSYDPTIETAAPAVADSLMMIGQ